MMLFQMCYGPEIQSIYEVIRRNPGCTIPELRAKFQYQPDGDITSLIDAVIVFLSSLGMVSSQTGKLWVNGQEWDDLDLLLRIKEVAQTSDPDSLDHVFATMHYRLFVQADCLFIQNLHYHTNQQFRNVLVGKEKINAWKRMMECFGLGFRVYSGFYALPQQRLMEQLVKKSGEWEGPLQQYCEEQIHPIIPCVDHGQVFRGIIFGLSFLHKRGIIHLSRKQDLPYNTYGDPHRWNWIKISEGVL